MEDVKVKTIKYAGLDPCCQIDYGKRTYFLGFNSRVLMDSGDPTYKVRRVEFWSLPEAVQREYLLWKMSLGQN